MRCNVIFITSNREKQKQLMIYIRYRGGRDSCDFDTTVFGNISVKNNEISFAERSAFKRSARKRNDQPTSGFTTLPIEIPPIVPYLPENPRARQSMKKIVQIISCTQLRSYARGTPRTGARVVCRRIHSEAPRPSCYAAPVRLHETNQRT